MGSEIQSNLHHYCNRNTNIVFQTDYGGIKIFFMAQKIFKKTYAFGKYRRWKKKRDDIDHIKDTLIR